MINKSFLMRECARTHMVIRWMCIIVLLLAISLFRIHDLESVAYATNIWDCIFIVTNHPHLLLYAYIPIYLVLLSDTLFSTTISQEYLYQIRLGHRQIWWINKMTFVILNTLCYVISLLLCSIVIAGLLDQPFSWHWSEYSKYIFENNFMLTHVPTHFANYSPGVVVFLYLLLLLLLFLSLASISQIFTLFLNNGYGGSLLVYSLLLLSEIARTPQLTFSKYMLMNNLYINPSESSPGDVSLWLAYSVLSLLVVLSILFGGRISLRKDFLSKEHAK